MQKKQNSSGLQYKESNSATLIKPSSLLILRNDHKNNQQEGSEHVRNLVPQNIWIGIQNDLRLTKNKCNICRMCRAQKITRVMSDLREQRSDASTSFTNVGVDYFDSFIEKIGPRNEKRCCCLSICLTMRAVQIVVLSKFDKDNFLDAIMRFIARRGKSRTIISDNETNFVGDI